MSGNIGVEAVPATPNGQSIVLYPFVNPPTELFDATNLPTTDTVTAISVGNDGTQIWKITHNGVDTHPIHFHLYDVQLLNRVTWDNIIIPPEPSELGWKDTVRVSPLEDTYFAIRPIIPVLPWEIVNNIRPLNPMMPIGDTSMFNSDDVNNIPVTPIENQLINFGWEYMLHCHILSHEEMDMMRPVVVAVPPIAPDGLSYAFTGSGNKTRVMLTWNDNSINETSFLVQRSPDGLAWADLTTIASPLDQPNTHRTGLTYIDTTYNRRNDYVYRVVAQNTAGLGGDFPSVTAKSMTANLIVAAPVIAPTGLSALVQSATQVRLTWTDNTTNETGFVIMRSDNGAAPIQLATIGARINTGTVTYNDNTVVLGHTYTYQVAAKNLLVQSAYSNLVTVTVSAPDAPTNLTATPVRQGNGERVTLTWTDVATNEFGYIIQWSATPDFATVAGSANIGANSTQYITGTIARQIWYFRIAATNGVGQSAWVTTGQIASAGQIALADVKYDTKPIELIFMDEFTDGLSGWTGQVGYVQVSPLAAMGDVEGQGLLATLGDDDPSAVDEDTPAYVYNQSVPLSSHLASFYFNPNGAFTGTDPIDIYTGLNADGVEIFGVQYLHTADAPTVYQVRAWALTIDGEVYTDWVAIDNAEQYLLLDWQSSLLSTLNLYVKGDVAAWVTADTDLDQAVEVRLGPSREANVTSSGTMYFDQFVSLSSTKALTFSIYMPMLVKKHREVRIRITLPGGQTTGLQGENYMGFCYAN